MNNDPAVLYEQHKDIKIIIHRAGSERNQQIVKERMVGMTYKEISNHHNISQSRVQQIVNKAIMQSRPEPIEIIKTLNKNNCGSCKHSPDNANVECWYCCIAIQHTVRSAFAYVEHNCWEKP